MDMPVGTDWERRYTELAVDLLNDAWQAGEPCEEPRMLRRIVKIAQDRTPYEAPPKPEGNRLAEPAHGYESPFYFDSRIR